MNLADARLWRFTSDLVSPVEVRPGLALRERQTLLIEFVGEDGRTAWGEAAPLPGFSRETLDEVVSEARKLVRNLLARGRTPVRVTDSMFPQHATPPSLEFAFEVAIAALATGGPDSATGLRTARLLQGGRDAILGRAEASVAAGYRCLKLKVGRGPVDDDVELLEEIRDKVGGEVGLRADANRSWTFPEARRFAGGVADLGLEFVEEPLEDASGLERLHRETGVSLALDESLTERARPVAAIPGYVSAVVLKPTLLGGRRTRELLEAAHRAGIRAVMSSCYESGVGTAAVARMAWGAGGEPAAVGIGTIDWIARDCLDPAVDFSKPRLEVFDISPARVCPRKDRLHPIPLE